MLRGTLNANATEIGRVVLVAWSLLALLILQPFAGHPLPIRDWAGAIVILASTEGVSDAYERLMASFADEGRFQPAFMALFALQWEWFGEKSLGWQTVRFGVLLALLPTLAFFARKLGASAVAAALGAGIWLLASGGREGWYVLQVAEPFALAWLSVAALSAHRAGHSGRVDSVFSASLAFLLAVWCKETTIVAAPMLFLLMAGEQSWRRKLKPDRQTILAATAMGLTATAAVLPVLAVRSAATSTAYASRFSIVEVSAGRLANAFSAVFLPVTREWWFPANVVFVTLTVAGLWALWRRTPSSRHRIAALVSFPLCGAALYAAWPTFPGYYALSFAISLSALFALAVTELAHRSRFKRMGAYIGAGIIAAYGLLLGWNGAEADRAIREIDAEAVLLARSWPHDNRIVVGVPDPDASGGIARALLQYAWHVDAGVAGRLARDIPCDEVHEVPATRPSVTTIVFSHLCEPTRKPSHIQSYQRFTTHTELNWKTLRLQRQTTSLTVWTSSSTREP